MLIARLLSLAALLTVSTSTAVAQFDSGSCAFYGSDVHITSSTRSSEFDDVRWEPCRIGSGFIVSSSYRTKGDAQ